MSGDEWVLVGVGIGIGMWIQIGLTAMIKRWSR